MKIQIMVMCGLAAWGGVAWGQSEPSATTPVFAVPTVQLPLSTAPVPPKISGLADIVRAKFPLAVTYADFGLGWRELTYENTTYFTRGDTTLLNDAEYLVAYRFVGRETNGLAARDYIGGITGSAVPFQADDRFRLTLLLTNNLIAYVTDGNTNLRSFGTEPNRSALDPANFSDSFDQNLSLVYLRKIYDAVGAFSHAYLNVLPPMQTAFAAQKALLPFAENAAIFTQPGAAQAFKANPNLSNRKREHLRRKGRVVMFYEAAPAPDGLRAVLLLNGTVRRVNAKEWATLSALSGLE